MKRPAALVETFTKEPLVFQEVDSLKVHGSN